MAASPAPLISGQSEAVGGLAGEIAAAVDFRQMRKASKEKTEGEKDSLKKKKWSLKRKDKWTASGSSAQGEPVASPLQSSLGLEGEMESLPPLLKHL